MLIAIEGMDGVGKTTIAKELAKRNNYEYIGNAIHRLFGVDDNSVYAKSFQEKEDEIFLKSGNDILRAWLCSIGNIYTSTRKANNNIIVDRHILSNFQQNGTKENVKIYKTLVELIGVPDLSVILYASPEVRLSRIYNRNKDDKDLNDDNIKLNEYKKMINFAKKFNMRYIVVNTEDKSIEQITKEIEEKIEIMERKEKDENER